MPALLFSALFLPPCLWCSYFKVAKNFTEVFRELVPEGRASLVMQRRRDLPDGAEVTSPCLLAPTSPGFLSLLARTSPRVLNFTMHAVCVRVFGCVLTARDIQEDTPPATTGGRIEQYVGVGIRVCRLHLPLTSRSALWGGAKRRTLCSSSAGARRQLWYNAVSSLPLPVPWRVLIAPARPVACSPCLSTARHVFLLFLLRILLP